MSRGTLGGMLGQRTDTGGKLRKSETSHHNVSLLALQL